MTTRVKFSVKNVLRFFGFAIVAFVFLILFALLLVSCDFGKERRLRNIADRPFVNVVSSEPTAREIAIANTIAILDSLSAINTNRDFSARLNDQMTALIETREAVLVWHDRKSVFSYEEWNDVRTQFRFWRTRQINRGNFLDRCPPMDSWDSMSREQSDRYSEIRYALCPINYLLGSRVIIADLNFDGRKDVIFVVYPEDCLRGVGASHPPLYVTFISDDDVGGYVYNNFLINRLKGTFDALRDDISDRERWLWVAIYDVKSAAGVIEISGHSSIFLPNDPTCCPSILYVFLARMDRFGNGQVFIKGFYHYGREEKHWFELVLGIE